MDDLKQNNIVKDRAATGLDIAEAVKRTCEDLLALFEKNSVIAAELRDKFQPALADLVAFELRPLEAEYGAFKVADGTFSLNEKEVARLISYVLDDMKAQVGRGDHLLSASEIKNTIEEVTTLFALHELRHRTQGVEKFQTVQLLKAIGGRTKISTFDVQADRDAAVALAASKSGDLSSDEFLDHYQRALFYSIQYFFKIYPANASRPDKVCRVAALIFMLVRLEIYRGLRHLCSGSPISALSVEISSDHKSIAVFENDPKHRLLRAANDVADLPRFIENIEEGRLEMALEQAFSIVTAIGIN